MQQNSLQQPLSRLNIFSLKGVQMKTFHITWLTFFFCFFAWFGIAPLMPLVSESLASDKSAKRKCGYCCCKRNHHCPLDHWQAYG